MKESNLFKRKDGGRSAFTLIELLIVIAIILILIAIALPNFLEAQIRAKVTKAKGEIRSLTIAMESYALDWKIYPAQHERDGQNNRLQRGLFWLTSPNQYITSIPEDPFAEFSADSTVTNYITYELGGVEFGGAPIGGSCPPCLVTWAMFSNGPDAQQNIRQDSPQHNNGNPTWNYSPTNGTKSIGEIIYWGGDSVFIGYTVEQAASSRTMLNSMTPVGLNMDNVRYVRKFPPSP